MLVRALVFAAWAALGTVAGYGLLYAFTPFGLALLATCLLGALAVPEPGGSRWPEIIGLAAGPGVLAMYAGGEAAVVGGTIVAAVLVGYLLVGRARCARAA